ncbi:hypothetical protein M0R04_15490 [Candidatus Dojkabacteria bacterium]|jgi:NMD protein affecting ribosome stability and mRNA decay|nr:hypothetical protein [Candidatus Dojkabacteria bacterium]
MNTDKKNKKVLICSNCGKKQWGLIDNICEKCMSKALKMNTQTKRIC